MKIGSSAILVQVTVKTISTINVLIEGDGSLTKRPIRERSGWSAGVGIMGECKIEIFTRRYWEYVSRGGWMQWIWT